MNDLNDTSGVVPGRPESAPVDAHSPILTLRQARERAGLHPVALAAMLKVPVRRLEALEAGRFTELPDMTFARALALSVCRVLKVDPKPILATFPASNEVRLGDIEKSLNQPLPQRSMPVAGNAVSPINPRLSWPVGLAVLLVVVAAVLWFMLPQRQASVTAPLSSPVAETAVAASPDASPEAVVQEAPNPAELGAGTVTGAAVPTEAAEATASGLAPAAPRPESTSPAANASVLSLRARETSWVQVTGASGRVLLQRSLQPDETVALSSDLPLAVVLGRADEVLVTVRGQAFDVAPHARNNVARFEVR